MKQIIEFLSEHPGIIIGIVFSIITTPYILKISDIFDRFIISRFKILVDKIHGICNK